MPVQVNGSPLKVEVEHLRRKDFDRRDDHLRATVMEIVSTLKELLVMHPLYNEQLKSFANIGGDFHNPDKLADMAASLTSADEDALQAILEELSVPERCALVTPRALPHLSPHACSRCVLHWLLFHTDDTLATCGSAVRMMGERP